MFADPLLSSGKADLLDGGKIFVEICFAIALVASAVRVRLRRHGFRPQR
jgi:hypothetical protein